jgi:hypothetical protein
MNGTQMKQRMQPRGSALVSVILVLLVLTIVGVGIAYFTSMEDRLSGNTRIAKAGFYAADAGLRRGEAVLSKVVSLSPSVCGTITVSQLLAARSGTDPHVPGGGYPALVLDLSTFTSGGSACLGTDAQAYANVSIPSPTGVSVADKVTYSLYLRNNVDDGSGTDVLDTDSIVNLVSIGTVQLATGVVVTKIVEEQLNLGVVGAMASTQKGVNPAGTGSGTY